MDNKEIHEEAIRRMHRDQDNGKYVNVSCVSMVMAQYEDEIRKEQEPNPEDCKHRKDECECGDCSGNE